MNITICLETDSERQSPRANRNSAYCTHSTREPARVPLGWITIAPGCTFRRCRRRRRRHSTHIVEIPSLRCQTYVYYDQCTSTRSMHYIPIACVLNDMRQRQQLHKTCSHSIHNALVVCVAREMRNSRCPRAGLLPLNGNGICTAGVCLRLGNVSMLDVRSQKRSRLQECECCSKCFATLYNWNNMRI